MRDKIKSCPIVHWYKFHACTITTCKSHTPETAHKCLELDRRKPDGVKQFSDAELNLYKFRHRKISTRLVQMYRKNAVQDVKAVLVLYKYIQWIDENCKQRHIVVSEFAKELESKYPLKVKRLGWQRWMWSYLFDEDCWARFTQKAEGECSTFKQHQLLRITQEEYSALTHSFKPQTERK